MLLWTQLRLQDRLRSAISQADLDIESSKEKTSENQYEQVKRAGTSPPPKSTGKAEPKVTEKTKIGSEDDLRVHRACRRACEGTDPGSLTVEGVRKSLDQQERQLELESLEGHPVYSFEQLKAEEVDTSNQLDENTKQAELMKPEEGTALLPDVMNRSVSEQGKFDIFCSIGQ